MNKLHHDGRARRRSVLESQIGVEPHDLANDNRPPAASSRPEGASGVVLRRDFDSSGAPIARIGVLAARGFLEAHRAGAAEEADIIALWRGLGRALDLPLFIADETGALTACSFAPGEVSFPRRGGSALSGRRPRFLSRRRVGSPPARPGIAPHSPKRALHQRIEGEPGE